MRRATRATCGCTQQYVEKLIIKNKMWLRSLVRGIEFYTGVRFLFSSSLEATGTLVSHSASSLPTESCRILRLFWPAKPEAVPCLRVANATAE